MNANIVPTLQKAGPLSREDNLAIHNAFMALLKTEAKSEPLVKVFCDVRLPFVFEAMRFYIQINKDGAIQHFKDELLPFGEDLVQMASYKKEDKWTLCAYVVQTYMTNKDFISIEEHGYFSDLVYEYAQELDAKFIDLDYRCWTPPHSHEWCDSKGFVTSPPTTDRAPIFIGDMVDERYRERPLNERINFGAMNPAQRFSSVLAHVKGLCNDRFPKLHATVHMPVWGHTHTWKHSDKQKENIKIFFTISIARFNPQLKIEDKTLTVYDLPKVLAELTRVLEQKLAQPAAPHSHKIFSTAGDKEKDTVYFGIGATKGIGAVKNV